MKQDIVGNAKSEISEIGFVTEVTALQLFDEIERLKKLLCVSSYGHSHKCVACSNFYTPMKYTSEDCPYCGSDGTLPTPIYKDNKQ